MSIRNLDYLLNPRSVALIGASDTPASVGGVVARNLLATGFPGEIYFVNPRHQLIDGKTCYPDIASLPHAPDLAVIAIPCQHVPAVIAALGAKGCRASVIISAGFDHNTRNQILAAARPYVMRLLGPNSLGILLPNLGLNGSFAHLSPDRGNIAFLSQSGAVLTAVMDWAKPRHIGFSCLLSLGDQSDIDFGDLLDYLAGDPGTRAILLYIESIVASRKFMSAARLAARSKPTIAIKAGRFAQTAKAVASHTGALAGSDAVYDAALRRAGILRVDELSELFSAAEILSSQPLPQSDQLTILTNGGGMGILAADALTRLDGRLASLGPSTIEALDRVLPANWSGGNPVDIIGDATPQRYQEATRLLLEAPETGNLLILNCPTAVTDATAAAQAVINALSAQQTAQVPVTTCWIGDETARKARGLFSRHAVPSFETPEDAVRAFTFAVAYRQRQALAMETPPALMDTTAPDRRRVAKLIETSLADQRYYLSGGDAFDILSAYGIPVLPSATARDASDAARLAQTLPPPYALKILSDDIVHKSDVGGVALDLPDAAAVAAAAQAMQTRISATLPHAQLRGFVVEPMMRRDDALELILGIGTDPQFGPVILFGAGGTAVEVLHDQTIELPPLNLKLAREMMARTRIHRLLGGYRDRPAMPLDDIARCLVRLGDLAADRPEIQELDINPLLVREGQILAVDARIKLTAEKTADAKHLAIRPYPHDQEQWITDRDGQRFFVRPVRPEDEPAFQTGFTQLSDNTVRMRFFAPMKALSHATAARLTQIDYDREMAWVVTPSPESHEVLGVGRLVADPDLTKAEYAILIGDPLQGKGLGEAVMRIVINYARQRGIAEIFGDVLQENKIMLDLCKRLGFQLSPSPAGPLLCRTVLALK